VSELCDDGFIGVEVRVGGGEDEAEIEEEFISRVGGGFETDRVAEDTI
jgi:hypothetical protein